MGLRFKEKIYAECFFVTTTFKDWNKYGEIDGVYEGIIESLSFYCDKYKAHLLAYVLMPSHIHLVISISGKELGNFMRDFKKYISQKVARDCGIKDSIIWMHRYDSVALFSNEILNQKIEYIHFNPVKAGLVHNPEDWKWSSAGNQFRSK